MSSGTKTTDKSYVKGESASKSTDSGKSSSSSKLTGNSQILVNGEFSASDLINRGSVNIGKDKDLITHDKDAIRQKLNTTRKSVTPKEKEV